MSEHQSFACLPPGEPLPGKTYRADGWIYWDAPARFTPHVWATLLAKLGKPQDDYVILAQSSGTDHQGVGWIRGQLLIAPWAVENLFRMEKYPQ
jgi:hypothetical protein